MSDVTRLFGERAGGYASFRPDYPASLFDWLAASSPRQQRALDIGCGSGQASLALTTRFGLVLACDSSVQQLCEIRPPAELQLFAADAWHLPLKAASVDLITVAQALHWFADAAFFAEIRRILRPDGLFCAWCYGLMQINPAVDALVNELHGELLGDYWPAGRASVDNDYRDIVTGFARLKVPDFAIELRWSLAHLLGYLRTWSAVQRWEGAHGKDPVSLFQARLQTAWGDNPQQFIRWPLHLVAGYPGN